MKEFKYELKVSSIEEKIKETEKAEVTTYTIEAKDDDGLVKVKVSDVNEFAGISPKDSITVIIRNEQTTLADHAGKTEPKKNAKA